MLIQKSGQLFFATVLGKCNLIFFMLHRIIKSQSLHPSTAYLSLINGLICGVNTLKIKGRAFVAGSLFKCGTYSEMLIIFK